ncbi:glycosyltransferase [Bacteroides intestinalis]|jgi:glycosyltransferase involved in cell wall biosynthesis|nr:glycosyltransferase [Bacteroides intestinalis]
MKPFKILIVSKFLYARGGAEVYSINLGEILQKQGHEVRFFSMSYPQNIHVNEDKYFAEEVSFFHSSISGRLKAALRVFGVGIKENYKKILDEFQPDIVHLNNIHSYLSPIVAKLSYERGIKVIWTIHDYKLICPTYSCLYKKLPCEACFSNKANVIFRKCMKNNLSASFLAWGEAVYWNKKKLSKWTDTFICPSNFIAQKMKQGGYPAEKLHVICNFINDEKAKFITELNPEMKEIAYAYIGRLSEEKGINEFLKVAAKLPYKLYIAGNGPLENELKQKYSSDRIWFLGHLSAIEIIKLLKRVQFSVMPSICYENNPLSVIESLCCGTPVCGRRIGGIPELLEGNTDNHLFSNEAELISSLTEMFENSSAIERQKLSSNSCKRFSAELYYQRWLEVIQNI